MLRKLFLMWARESRRLADLLQAQIVLAAVAAQLGDLADAEMFAAAVLGARPDFSCEQYRRRVPFIEQADQDYLIDGLVKAGLPA